MGVFFLQRCEAGETFSSDCQITGVAPGVGRCGVIVDVRVFYVRFCSWGGVRFLYGFCSVFRPALLGSSVKCGLALDKSRKNVG